MDWSSFIAPGVVGALLGLYLKSISQRIDDQNAATAKQFEVIDRRFDETNRRLDALQTEVTSLGKGVARIEGRLDPYDRTTSHPYSEEERMKTASTPAFQEPPGQGQ